MSENEFTGEEKAFLLGILSQELKDAKNLIEIYGRGNVDDWHSGFKNKKLSESIIKKLKRDKGG